MGLLTVGSQAKPKDDVLQIGDAGAKQLVALKEEGKQTGLAAYFQKSGEKDLSAVLGPSGLPPMPANLAQGSQSPGKKYELMQEQSYGTELVFRAELLKTVLLTVVDTHAGHLRDKRSVVKLLAFFVDYKENEHFADAGDLSFVHFAFMSCYPNFEAINAMQCSMT